MLPRPGHRGYKCPVVFAVSDNDLCISLKGHGWLDKFLDSRAAGLPRFEADGNDLAAVHAQTELAVARARCEVAGAGGEGVARTLLRTWRSLARSVSFSFPLSLSLSHTHTHHTHSLPLSLSRSLALSHPPLSSSARLFVCVCVCVCRRHQAAGEAGRADIQEPEPALRPRRDGPADRLPDRGRSRRRRADERTRGRVPPGGGGGVSELSVCGAAQTLDPASSSECALPLTGLTGVPAWLASGGGGGGGGGGGRGGGR
eukprot:SAG22_NODE_2086_length_3031_cov_4.223056_6_plen_257_part_01